MNYLNNLLQIINLRALGHALWQRYDKVAIDKLRLPIILQCLHFVREHGEFMFLERI